MTEASVEKETGDGEEASADQSTIKKEESESNQTLNQSTNATPAPTTNASTTTPTTVPNNDTKKEPNKENQNKKSKADLVKLPIRQYMDATVVPSLLIGLSTLAKERPPKPLEFLGKFLLQKSKEQEES